jgi:hypothetical protein
MCISLSAGIWIFVSIIAGVGFLHEFNYLLKYFII